MLVRLRPDDAVLSALLLRLLPTDAALAPSVPVLALALALGAACLAAPKAAPKALFVADERARRPWLVPTSWLAPLVVRWRTVTVARATDDDERDERDDEWCPAALRGPASPSTLSLETRPLSRPL